MLKMNALIKIGVSCLFLQGVLFSRAIARNKTRKTSRKIIPLSAVDIAAFVEEHNQVRSEVTPTAADMEVMIWNEEAAATAGELARRCQFKHDDPDKRTPDEWVYCGQNLLISSNRRTVRQVVRLWSAQRKFFSYGVRSGNRDGRQVGHYTQVVWNSTSTVGCAMARCPTGYLYVCNYCPGGNFNRDRGTPYTEGDWGHSCKERSEEYPSLCEPPCRGEFSTDRYKSCGTDRLPCSLIPSDWCPRSCGLCVGDEEKGSGQQN